MERFNTGNDIDRVFSDAFFKSEMVPPTHIWTNIQSEVAVPVSRKKPWVLIAATISLVSIASYLFTLIPIEKEISPALSATDKASAAEKREADKPTPKETIHVGTTDDSEEKTSTNSHHPLVPVESSTKPIPKPVPSVIPPSLGQHVGQTRAVESLASSPADTRREPEVWINHAGLQLETDRRNLELSMVPFWRKKLVSQSSSRYWAQAGFGAGNSGTVDGLGGQAMDAAFAEDLADFSTASVQSQNESNGTAFSTALTAGTRLGNKWLVESGLGFMSTELAGTTNAIEALGTNRYPVYYQPRFNGDVAFTSTISMQTKLRFLSIPVRFGYRIIDRKVGWLVTSGISNNFLVSQVVSSPTLDSYSLKSDQSPFRTVYLSGTLGTELYVEVWQHYQLGLNSQVGLGLTDLTKPEAPMELKPSLWQVGINIRYIFK